MNGDGARRLARLGIGSALVLASILAMGVLTRVQHQPTAADAVLRLAWRTRVPRVETCRRPTAEEQADLPVHMRRSEICQGRTARYRLEVRVDGAVRHRAEVAASGVRGDRPMHVLEAVPLEPGERRIHVAFERVDTAGAVDAGLDDGLDDGPVPNRLEFDELLDVQRRDVVLITYDPDARRLVRKESREE